ncbi:MAG: PKD domain-containing protein [Thermoplasmatota archaeon]
MRDEHSGIDNSTVEYRSTTQGLFEWGPWDGYHLERCSESCIVRLEIELDHGFDNYIQVRATDNAGNSGISIPFNIKMNTYPVIVVSTPSSSDRLMEGQEIIFDATPSYDPDGDRLTISWHISDGDGEVSMGDSYRVSNILEPGEYTVTVIAKDRVNNEVRYHFRITVDKIEFPYSMDNKDTDGDGIPDWWEFTWQTNYLVKDAQEDPDRDGFTNLEEYQNSTHPNSPQRPKWEFTDNSTGGKGLSRWVICSIIFASASFISIFEIMFFLLARKRHRWRPLREIRSD